MSTQRPTGENASANGYFGTLLANTPDIMYIVDSGMVFREASDSFAKFLGLGGPEDVVGRSVYDLITDEELLARHLRDDKLVLEKGESLLGFTEDIPDPTGARRYLLCSKYPIRGEDGSPNSVLCVSRDMTGEYEAREDYLRQIQYLLRMEGDVYGAWLFDMTVGRVVESRSGKGGHAGIPSRDSVDAYINSAIEFSEENDELQVFLREFSLENLLAMFKSGQRQRDFEYRRLMSDGRRCWVHLTAHLLMDPVTRHLMALMSMTDINSVKSAQSELIKAAELDAMTGVLNHDATLSHMEQFLAGEGAGGSHALVMVDRDGLKSINDTFGHQIGDEIIVETARVLVSVFRDTDIIGRVGGDEFLILMKNIGKTAFLRRKAAELLQSLQCICGPADNAIETTGSVGISLYKGDGKTMDKLYAEADTALYKAKAEGRNRFILYKADDDYSVERADERDSLMDTINLRTLLNSIDGGILIMHTEPDKPLQPVFFSDSFLTMMGGLTQDEAFTLYGPDLFDCIHPDERERVRSEYAAAIDSGEPLRTTYRLLGKDGVYNWLSAGTNITKNEDGKIDVYAVHTNIEKLMHREEKLASDEQRFRMAFSQTSRTLCELDAGRDSLVLFTRDGKDHGPESVIEGLPESPIQSGFIHQRSAEDFRRFYAGLKAGKAKDRALFKCRYFSTGAYGWAAISYEAVLDSGGSAVKAVGSIEELPNVGRELERQAREENLLAALKDDLLISMKVNVSEDAIEYYTAAEPGSIAETAAGSYSGFSEQLFGSAPYPEDAMLLQLNISRESLLEARDAGRNWLSVEFRRVDGGEIRWTKLSAALGTDPLTHQHYAFIGMGDVEKRRAAEALLPIVPERDPVTHIYTQSTTEKLIDSLIRSSPAAERLYSLALIRMIGLPALAARIGAENVDVEKMFLSRFISSLLDSDCIVGRYNGDGILVFCPDTQSDQWIKERIEGALLRLREARKRIAVENQVRLICGVTTERARSADLTGMLSQAVRVCDNYQSSETQEVYSFAQYMDSFRLSEEALDRSSFLTFDAQEQSRPLLGSEREALGECMAAMLAADSFDASANGALGVIGRFYGAQRVYTLTVLEGGATVSGAHEWVAAGRHSTIRQMAGMSVDKFPMFKRTLTAAKPILLDGRPRRGFSIEGRENDSPWRFISIPVISDGRISGLMCIENPEKNASSVALPCAIIPLLLHDRGRYGAGSTGLRVAGRDALTGLSDRASFEEAMHSFNPDAYHAIGVLYISVINLRELNRVNGVAYGDDMLVFAAQTFTGVIKKAQIFRMSGPEFVIFSSNLSREAFQGQCARIQSVLQRRYPRAFCFGSSWSDKNLSARKLLATAEMLAHSGEERSIIAIPREEKPSGDMGEITSTGLSEGRFYVLLQPQVDMRTGTVVGAEVLTRCRDNSGRTIMPSEFVRAFEEAGVIRDLDYFALDSAFAILQRIIDQGLGPVPLSVNFSRQTLMSATVLASTLAIRSRYDVPDELVEIEVTESIGKYEPDTLREIMDGMYQEGFRFSLDDLGSEYSSLKTLGDLSFDAVKLDRSLISSFLYNAMSRSVTESIVTVCAKNNIRCIAEGVESEMHVKGLIEAGCVFAQGYFYGKPMPPEEFCKKYLR